jgi:1,2-diacylglycerol-3-alpha-glucose alpha-1,2-galactosyltransferase
MKSINMLSTADKVKGQGVGSAYIEQVNLVKSGLGSNYEVFVNKLKIADIMHYHSIDTKFYLLLHLAKLKSVNVGYVHFIPETVDSSIKLPKIIKKLLFWYIVSFYKNMDHLVTVNPYFVRKLEELGIKREKVTYIPNFVSDKTFFEKEQYEKDRIRKQYGIDRNAFVVLGAGQVQTRKGVMDFIEVAQSLKDVQFIWAGGFSFGRITLGYKELKPVVEKPPQNVKFLGILDREKMNDVFNISDLLFMPSYQELFPMTILEAFNCKVPILLRDLDIYPDIFFDYYLKGETNQEFVNEIFRLKSDPEYYCKSKGQSWKGHQFYCKENVLLKWKEFYNKLIEKR